MLAFTHFVSRDHCGSRDRTPWWYQQLALLQAPRSQPDLGAGRGRATAFYMQRKAYQVVDDVELVVLPVPGVDPAVLLLPHVVPQRAPVPEGLLAVQALQAADGTRSAEPPAPVAAPARPAPAPVLAGVAETARGDVRVLLSYNHDKGGQHPSFSGWLTDQLAYSKNVHVGAFLRE